MCKYCSRGIALNTSGDFHNINVFVDKDEKELTITCESEEDELMQLVEIYFCPMCGEKL